ncbi:MAG TPA: glucuronate isomerase [Puia sp.]|jgi:glucuronate isomerase|nr:glucuronate isomerase [Puia sp.]
MKKFLDQDFLLDTETGKRLYHDYAADLPIIDYHCHLPVQQIAENHRFENLTEIWLRGDHYKWRAMRINGVNESYITGEKNDWEKFLKWAETVPYTLRNPLYHWTHLELQRYFGVDKILHAGSAKEIYEYCNQKLQTSDFRVHGLLKRMKVEVICTTDDPVDSLEYHHSISKQSLPVKVLPAFRPDQALAIGEPKIFINWLGKLSSSANISITTFQLFLDALKSRHDYFHSAGCRISDHGLEKFYEVDWTETELKKIFEKVRNGNNPDRLEIEKFQSALLLQFAEWDFEKKWVQQFHLGALRNNNSRMLSSLGPDTGWDSIGDFPQARALSTFLNSLDRNNRLAKTILYNNNPADNEMMATMIGNFNDGSVPGKVQWGSAWWFLDQKDGMTKQLNAFSNMALISRFIGMITDSRSFLSYSRHEYFRRIVCGLFGQEIEKGELPHDTGWTGKIIKDICYFNASHFFNWNEY